MNLAVPEFMQSRSLRGCKFLRDTRDPNDRTLYELQYEVNLSLKWIRINDMAALLHRTWKQSKNFKKNEL